MRIGVVGAGAVGGAIAALLSRVGHEVEITARGAHLEAIQEHGIILTGAWGDYRAQVDAAEELTRGVELVIIATKAQDAPAAIRDNISVLRGIPLVVIQNGLDSMANAKAASPRSDIVGGLATFASSYLSPGTITVTTAGPLYLGVTAPDSDVPARYAARILAEALPTSTVANFTGAQWTKLIINMVNALPAITGLSVQEVLKDAALKRILTTSMQECVRTGLNSRVHFETLQGLTHRRLRWFAAMPVWMAGSLPALMAKRMGKTPNPGSTLQSIKRGQATEIDYLNGAVVRAAQAIGREAPVNAELVKLVHEVERTKAFLTPAEVARRFA